QLNVKPTEKEIKNFRTGTATRIGEKEVEDSTSAPFRHKDTVRVVSGDLAGLTGEVVSIKTPLVYIMAHHDQLNEPLSFSPDELEKYFVVGAHIKIFRGPNKGETGFVTETDNDQLVIFSDTSNKMVKANISNAVETSEM
ncbi:Transcription elongation factor SPT5, partial [Bonamia ostreae]